MKNTKRIKNNDCRCETSSSFTQKKPISFSKKESILFSHKSFLEILLNTIKKSQLSLFSKISDKKIPNKKIIIEILTELKENLNSMHKEEKTKIYFYESQLLNQKSIIQSQLYEDKHKNKNLQKLKGEIEQLKTLNFMAQNEIKLIENLTQKNICIDKFLDKNILTTEEEKEINCFQPKYFSTITFTPSMRKIFTCSPVSMRSPESLRAVQTVPCRFTAPLPSMLLIGSVTSAI